MGTFPVSRFIHVLAAHVLGGRVVEGGSWGLVEGERYSEVILDTLGLLARPIPQITGVNNPIPEISPLKPRS